jgi:tetratricopeptide (TPR) repeat protein
VQLARRALEFDPGCTDAYVILAERATMIEVKLDHYVRGLESAEQKLGAAYFAENAGHFWEIWATRPYMRARLGVAESLATVGRADEALVHYAELLRLNPKDDQCVRYFLLPLLMAAGRDVEAAQLLKQFDDKSANWGYLQALLAFRLTGPSAAADLMLRKAIGINLHVLELLSSDARFPRPSRYAQGSFEEACFVAEQLRPACEVTDGALDWFSAARQRLEQEHVKRRREARRRERAQRKKGKRR